MIWFHAKAQRSGRRRKEKFHFFFAFFASSFAPLREIFFG